MAWEASRTERSIRGDDLVADQKYRMTQQRKIIMNEVRKLHSHPTADEIYVRVRKKLPHISMGTVYRNLDILSRTGFIKKIDPGSTQMRFDGKVEDHYHIICMVCSGIEDVPLGKPDHSLDQLEKAIVNVTNYSVFGHNLEFIGLCPKCAREGQSSLGEKMKALVET